VWSSVEIDGHGEYRFCDNKDDVMALEWMYVNQNISVVLPNWSVTRFLVRHLYVVGSVSCDCPML